MRITLFNNTKAGTSKTSGELRQALEKHGHQLVISLEKGVDVQPKFLEGIDLVVAAGGDGTVARAAKALAGHDVPLAILPLGTANNIAESLGVGGEVDALVARWQDARREPFDLGTARGPWGERLFLESVGGGLVATGIQVAAKLPEDAELPTAERVCRAANQFRAVLSEMKPRRYALTLNGTCEESELLLVEVLNIKSIGPKLVLTAEADSSDGWLTVVTVGEAEREHLAAYLRHRAEGWEVPADLPFRRARRVEIETEDDLHVDDDPLDLSGRVRTTIELAPGALTVLV